MKTKDLIAELRNQDPSGELNVCVGNVDILFVHREPAYYDGPLQVMERDPTERYYDVKGFDIVYSGEKVQIQTHSWKDALLDTPDMPIRIQYPERHEHLVQRIEKYRKAMKSAIERWNKE